MRIGVPPPAPRSSLSEVLTIRPTSAPKEVIVHSTGLRVGHPVHPLVPVTSLHNVGGRGRAVDYPS